MKVNNKLLRILQHGVIKILKLYVNYNALRDQFHIICLVHKFTYHRDLLPKIIYHNYFIENYKIHQ